MSNNSSPSTPRYGGDEYHRRLAGLPLQDSPNSDRQSPVFLQLGYGEMVSTGHQKAIVIVKQNFLQRLGFHLILV